MNRKSPEFQLDFHGFHFPVRKSALYRILLIIAGQSNGPLVMDLRLLILES